MQRYGPDVRAGRGDDAVDADGCRQVRLGDTEAGDVDLAQPSSPGSRAGHDDNGVLAELEHFIGSDDDRRAHKSRLAPRRHSGAGRVIRVRMSPMSLYESGESTGTVSLRALLDGESVTSPDCGLSLGDVLELACRGGWPQSRDADLDAAADASRAYLSEISRTDVSRVDGVERDPLRINRLLASLARNVATEVRHTMLAADTAMAGQPPLERRTVAGHLAALARLFVVEEVPAWRPHLASRAQVRRSPEIHLADPSLTAAALGAGVDELMRDLGFAGRLFESMAIRDLQVYARANRCSLSHYRDSDNLEVDLIVEHPDGRWVAAEIKLGGPDAIDKAAHSLHSLVAKLDRAKTSEPAKLVVITTSGYGYERHDNITVVPLTALAP